MANAPSHTHKSRPPNPAKLRPDGTLDLDAHLVVHVRGMDAMPVGPSVYRLHVAVDWPVIGERTGAPLGQPLAPLGELRA